MATSLVKIGNSRGVRIPKNVIEQLHLGEGPVALEVRKDCLLIKPVKKPAKRATATNGQGAAAANRKPAIEQAKKRVRDPAWLKYMRNLPYDENMGIPRAADRAMKPRQFTVYSVIPRSHLVAKNDRRGYPCVVISPDDDNANPKISTVFLAPLAEGVADPYRVGVRFDGKEQLVFFDYFHSVRKGNLISRLGDLSRSDARRVAYGFRDVFVNPILGV